MAFGELVHDRVRQFADGKRPSRMYQALLGRNGRGECAELLAHLTASLADKTLPARLGYDTRPDWLIVDEFAFDRIERTECAPGRPSAYCLTHPI